MLDRSVNVRLPLDLLHRLETKIAAVNVSRAKSRGALDGRKRADGETLAPITISEAIRKTVAIGLDVMDRDPDTFEDYFLEFFADKLTATLALAATDPAARRLLKKIAEGHKPPTFEADATSDFG